jgi:hypothetical protein
LAHTWHILPDGAGSAPAIQAGIDSSADGDTVLLANGTFSGSGNRNIRYRGKAVVVRSESGNPALCIVDCAGLSRGFIFDPASEKGVTPLSSPR